jgi:hypothetical protein
MYILIYIDIYTYRHLYIYILMNILIYVNIYKYIYTYTYIYISINIFKYTFYLFQYFIKILISIFPIFIQNMFHVPQSDDVYLDRSHRGINVDQHLKPRNKYKYSILYLHLFRGFEW